ncbi:MAG: protein kinase, partial [Planctomycetaceae bacterium]|nr:protein kinase [Planctomycetaceae bacterium]
ILGKAARSKTAVARFLTEAKSMAELSHPNIVQIYDYGRATRGPFLIMECVQGGSLLEKCKAGPIELDEAVNIFGQLCDGLAKAHAANIIHRDIKPANVLMTEDGIPKLTDFGLAKDDTADTGMTMEGAVIGTLDFMPPEQRKGAEFTDHRSDLWSLAATFYQMLTGKSPKVINIASLPPKLHSVVAKALEESKEDRFQSAMEMREAILQAHSGKMDTSRSLGEGECPECATRNLPDRKFCRECSVKLQVSCLKCEQDMAIWDKGCGECGAQQAPLVQKALADLKDAHDDAENLLTDLEFEAAAKESEFVGSEVDSRLQQYATWHEDFLARLESSRTSEHARLEELLEEAKTHEENYDYEAARDSLSKVDNRLTDHVLENLGSAKTISKRITEVLAIIKKLSTANDTVKEKAVSFLEEFEFDKAIDALREIETDVNSEACIADLAGEYLEERADRAARGWFPTTNDSRNGVANTVAAHHPHLKEYDAWFVEFSEEVQSKRHVAYKQLEEQLSQALEHEENYDYESARDSLSKIDKRLEDHELETLGSAKSILARITQILARIKKLSTANNIVKKRAVAFLKEFEFDKAIEASTGIETDDHPHLKEDGDWLNEFVVEVQTKRNAVYKHLVEQLSQALEHEEQFDYESGLESLTHVDSRLFETPAPSPLARQADDLQPSAPTAEEISKRLSEKIRRADELKKTVRDRYRKKELSGLLSIVDELLTLKPDRSDVQKLKEQLDKRDTNLLESRDAAINKATQQLGEQQYAEAVTTLSTVSEEVYSEQFNKLKTKASDLLNQLNTLRDRITTAVNGNQFKSLLHVVEDCLTLKADQVDLVKLKEQLEKRDADLLEARDAAINKATLQLGEQQYAEAVVTLNMVSAEVSSEQLEELKTKARDLLKQLNTQRDRITTVVNGNQLKDLLPAVEKCLALKSDQDDLVKLKQDLIARETRLNASNQEIISQAQMQLQQRQFDAVVQTLEAIAPEYQTSLTVELSQKAAVAILARAPITNTIGMTFNKIPAGTFVMGSPETEFGRGDDEHQHKVTISKPFYMQTTEVTQGQWKAVMGTEPWQGQDRVVKEGRNYAATHVSWNGAVAYCEKVSE